MTVGGADLSFRRAKDGTVSTLFSKARKNNEGRWRDEEFKLQEQFSGLTAMSVWLHGLMNRIRTWVKFGEFNKRTVI